MAFSSVFHDYLGRGLLADLPDLTSFDSPLDTAIFYYATDTDQLFTANGDATAWVEVGGSGGSAAYVNFTCSGGAVTLNRQSNIASVVRNAQGKYRITFTAALPDVFYSVGGQGRFGPYGDNNWIIVGPDRTASQTAAYIDVLLSEHLSNSLVDPSEHCSIIIVNA